MKNKLILFTPLFLIACGGGSSNTSNSTDSAYSGSGIGSTRLKTITSSNDTDTWTETYFYDGLGKGRLGSIVSNGNPEGDTTKSFEYNYNGKYLSRIIETGNTSFSWDNEGAPFVSEQNITYGTTTFLPTQNPTVDSTNDSYESIGSSYYSNSTAENQYFYLNNASGATRLEKVTGKTFILTRNYEGVLQSLPSDENTWETSYKYNNDGKLKESSTTHQQGIDQNNFNNTANLQEQLIGQQAGLIEENGSIPSLGGDLYPTDEVIFTTTYKYNLSNQLESEFRVDNWYGNFTHHRKDYTYENGILKTRKDYIKHTVEQTLPGVSAPGAVIPIEGLDEIGSPPPFVPPYPVNEWILESTSTYLYESGDCYYHYPDTGYFKSTDLQTICPR